MNTNDLLAAAGPGQRVPFGMILLAIVVLGALGFGAVQDSRDAWACCRMPGLTLWLG